MRIPRKLCGHPKKWTLRTIFQTFYTCIFIVLVLVALLYILSSLSIASKKRTDDGGGFPELIGKRRAASPEFKFHSSIPFRRLSSRASHTSMFKNEFQQAVSPGGGKCSMYNCFDIHRCGKDGHHSLSVYIYPVERWEVDGVLLNPDGLSRDFLLYLDTLRKSPYLVEDPDDACIFIPTIDTFRLKDTKENTASWGINGQNHLLVSMSPGSNSSLLSLKTDAILADSSFHVASFRSGFYVPIISHNPIVPNEIMLNSSLASDSNYFRNKRIIAINAQINPPTIFDSNPNILVLNLCEGRPFNYWQRCADRHIFRYPQVLQNSDFCVIYMDVSSPLLWEIMSVGCIPVIIAPSQRLPFDDMIDWEKNAVLLSEHQVPEMSFILKSIGKPRVWRLKAQVELTFTKHFKSIRHITKTLLEVLQDRVFTYHARSLQTWNNHITLDKPQRPLFNPVLAPSENGFTAVILAYERVPSLFKVIECLSAVPSLSKIIVVWNNQRMLPPPYSNWPRVAKPVKVIQMKENKMSNRFVPFSEIETEAVFSVDDDIVMLSVDEIEFGFQTWREFPDRIVGFPSRSHVWDNVTQKWRYESEWTNQISMVLTGASFYHKYWHHAYTHEMPDNIREIVDFKMNCEDIAMNFLVAATTGQPPIKVTPRKKFKCPTCNNNEMLSSDSRHMMERTECINRFFQIYGYMPLCYAEFRADPVLYKVENLKKKFKKYSNVGSL